MPHESFEVQTVDYCKWELFQGGLWVIICSAPQGAVLGPRGQQFHRRVKHRQSNTCWATDSQHETSQQACLLFLMSVIYMKEPLSPNRNRVLYTAVWLTGFHISLVPAPPTPSLNNLMMIAALYHKAYCQFSCYNSSACRMQHRWKKKKSVTLWKIQKINYKLSVNLN